MTNLEIRSQVVVVEPPVDPDDTQLLTCPKCGKPLRQGICVKAAEVGRVDLLPDGPGCPLCGIPCEVSEMYKVGSYWYCHPCRTMWFVQGRIVTLVED